MLEEYVIFIQHRVKNYELRIQNKFCFRDYIYSSLKLMTVVLINMHTYQILFFITYFVANAATLCTPYITFLILLIHSSRGIAIQGMRECRKLYLGEPDSASHCVTCEGITPWFQP